MFIDGRYQKVLLAPAERNGPEAIAGNIALRWSAGRAHTGFYKHLAPLEPEPCLLAA